ncbi:MAG: SDR family oxidoreductase [Clostridiales bacterium]|nr:SDR family oxidoreductase [Clostridiales bacterium]
MKKSWLNGKKVVISGASGGLGFAMAKLLIEEYGCSVLGIARNEKKILNAIETLGDNKDKFTYQLFDVSKKENWTAFNEYLETNGINIDLLINNAGFMLPFSKFENYTEQEIDEIINTNFVSNVYSIKTLLPNIKRSKTPAIVNIASAAGLCAVVGESMYCATKFAVHGLTETLQQDYRKKIYIGGVYPGFIKTDILCRQTVNDKESKLINRLMMPVNKAAKKIVRRIHKRKKRTVMGFDGRSMGFFGRLFPKLTPTLITKVLKISKLELFNDATD